MKSLTTSTILLTFLLISCGPDSENNLDLNCEGTDPDKINIRVMNISSFDVQDLNYNNVQTFSTLQPGETTEYIPLDGAADVPNTIAMTINGQELRYILIDNLGLTQLNQGCYTYLLHAFEYGEGNIYANGRVYDNANLVDFNPDIQDCPELENTNCNTDVNSINIRVKNASAFDMCNMAVDMTSTEEAIYGDLASGETSCYIPFTSAKKYPFRCTFKLGDEDYLIENPLYFANLDDLEAGLYTYNIFTIRPQDKFGDIQLSME